MNKGFIKIGALIGILAVALLTGMALYSQPSITPVQATQQGDGCEHECPTFEFSAKECPNGYHPFGPLFCEKNGQQFDLPSWITPTMKFITTSNLSDSVHITQYVKKSEPKEG